MVSASSGLGSSELKNEKIERRRKRERKEARRGKPYSPFYDTSLLLKLIHSSKN
jgi:hypothetical protein